MKSVILTAVGGPENFTLTETPGAAPADNHIRVRNKAIGVNFIDIYQRKGLYPISVPSILGQEGAGVVAEAGAGAPFKVGERVAYLSGFGAYAEETIVDAARAALIPAGVSDDLAAASFLKGLTAEMLLRQVYALKAGQTALITAAAGGVGSLLTAWAAHIGARVIAVVGDENKIAAAKANGAHDVIDRRANPEMASAVRRLTDGRGVDVVYDSVGAATFEASLDSLALRGMMVSYGNASGPVPPVAPLELTRRGSLTLARPSLFHYATPGTPARHGEGGVRLDRRRRPEADDRQILSARRRRRRAPPARRRPDDRRDHPEAMSAMQTNRLSTRPLFAAGVALLAGCMADADRPAPAKPEAVSGWRVAPEGDLNTFFDCLEEAGAALVAAHRGGPARGFPENAIETFENTLAGAPALLEIDVATSSDGVLYLMHDDTLDRMTTGTGATNALSWAEISTLSLKDWSGVATDFHPPSFADALAWGKGKTILEIDFKQTTRYEDAIDEINRQEAEDRVILIAYTLAQAERLHRLAPDIMISLSVSAQSDLNRTVAAGVPLDRLLGFTGVEEPNPRLFSILDNQDVEVVFGTLGGRDSIDSQIEETGDDSLYATLAGMGADIIATDRPFTAQAALDDAGRGAKPDQCGIRKT